MRMNKRKVFSVLLGLGILTGSWGASAHVSGHVLRPENPDVDYILGRPMTEEEIAEQEAMVPELKEMPLPDELVEPVQSQDRGRTGETAGVKRFDLRDEGIVTSVKNQVVDGPCWAFSAIASAESSMMKQSSKGELDYSEEHLAYFFYNRQNDPLGNTLGDRNIAAYEWENYKSIGGNMQLASKFLSTWSGAAGEAAFPYSTDTAGLDNARAYESEAHLQNARFISEASVDDLKEALYRYRQPVGINYYHDNTYWNKETGAYCCPVSKGAINHAVTIVGWDDSYSRNNFSGVSQVSGDGAWIVKNSWGEQSGDQGYIYISYEDQTLAGGVSADFEPVGNYDHNYQYDGSSGSSSISVDAGASHANVFQVKGNPSGSEILKAVGILMNSSNVQLAVDVYTDLQDPLNPSGGTHAVEGQRVSTSYTGYYTFPLEQEVHLWEGSYFSVIFTNISDTKKSFAIESAVDSGWIRFETGVESGQSFYREKEGKTWRDMNGQYLSNGKAVNSRIKAYTTDSQELPQPTATPIPQPTTAPDPQPTAAPEESAPKQTVITGTVSNKKKITLKWGKVTQADCYQVYRRTSADDKWKLAGSTEKTSYVDKGLSPASPYRYRVRAVRGVGTGRKTGAYSSVKKVLTKPAVPEKISFKPAVKPGRKTKALFSCKTASGVSGYEIYQYNPGTKKYKPAYRIAGDKVSIYQKSGNRYKKIGKAVKSGGKITCTLTKIDLNTYKKQYFKVRAYAEKSGYSRQYSSFSGKIVFKCS